MAHLSRWLDERRVAPRAVTAEELERFQEWRRERYSHLRGLARAVALLDICAGSGRCPIARQRMTPVERRLADYREYLCQERGLVAGSVRLRERVAREFLGEVASRSTSRSRSSSPVM